MNDLDNVAVGDRLAVVGAAQWTHMVTVEAVTEEVVGTDDGRRWHRSPAASLKQITSSRAGLRQFPVVRLVPLTPELEAELQDLDDRKRLNRTLEHLLDVAGEHSPRWVRAVLDALKLARRAALPPS